MKSTVLVSVLILLSFMVSCTQQEYHPSRGEQLVKATLGRGAKVIKEKYHLRPCGSGVAMPGGPIQSLTLCFDTKYPHTKEQLRELLIKCSADLLHLVNENEEMQKFLIERPFTIKNIDIIIYNHDEKGFILNDPYISVANIFESCLTYRSIDPEDRFRYKNRYKESLDEAFVALSLPSQG